MSNNNKKTAVPDIPSLDTQEEIDAYVQAAFDSRDMKKINAALHRAVIAEEKLYGPLESADYDTDV